MSLRMMERKDEAVRALYDEHKDEVFGFLMKLLGDRALAEDILQESFVRVHASWDRFDQSKPFRPWLFAIVRNLVASTKRKKRERPIASEASISDRIVKDLSREESRERAETALAALGDDARMLLIQRHGLDMKLEELAQAMGCTERTVTNRLRAAAEEFTRAWLSTQEGGRS